jgi:hypothetical protein
MTDDIAGTNQRGERRTYVKPFVRNLDAMETEGGKFADVYEITNGTLVGLVGPS